MNADVDLVRLIQEVGTEDDARAYLESLRWPNGPICPHCGAERAYKLTPKPESIRPVRPGVYKCRKCRKQFTVTVGTIFEDSHIPISKWMLTIHLMCASKKGVSAHQIHRMLGVSYKAAWFMCHRVRYAMTGDPQAAEKLSGVVEADETYIGGSRRGTPRGRPGPESHKVPVFALVERDGDVRSFPVRRVTASNLRKIMRENVAPEARIMTDEFAGYIGVRDEFADHQTVKHSAKEYARRTPHGSVHVNTAESYFALLKRGLTGTFHHVGERHLPRYCAEFDFRYNRRKTTDGARAADAVKGAEGKRMVYRPGKRGERQRRKLGE